MPLDPRNLQFFQARDEDIGFRGIVGLGWPLDGHFWYLCTGHKSWDDRLAGSKPLSRCFYAIDRSSVGITKNGVKQATTSEMELDWHLASVMDAQAESRWPIDILYQ